MELDKVAKLIERIDEKTKAHEIKWEKEASNSFATELGPYKLAIVEITPDTDYEADPDYFLSIRTAKGQSEWVDSFSDQELRKVMPNAFDAMGSLFKDVRRQATNVEGIIDMINKTLDDML